MPNDIMGLTEDLASLDDDIFEQEGRQAQQDVLDVDDAHGTADGPAPVDDTPAQDTQDTGDGEEDDLITAYLKSKGVKDPREIMTEDENGNLVKKDFNSLTREEQLDILGAHDEPDNGLFDDEINFLNKARESNVTIDEYVDWLKRSAVQEYIDAQEEPSDIDALSDDELYLLDLKDTSPDLTDEECVESLNSSKANQALWEKRMQGLRKAYKAKEEARLKEEAANAKAEAERDAVQFQTTIQDAVSKMDSIGEFDLDKGDKDQIAEFLLGMDKTGTRHFARALNDPDTLAKMAWFALYGEDALESLSKYYKEQIESYSRSNYKRGYDDGQKGRQAPAARSTVRKPVANGGRDGYKPLSTPNLIDLD